MLRLLRRNVKGRRKRAEADHLLQLYLVQQQNDTNCFLKFASPKAVPMKSKGQFSVFSKHA